MFYYYGAKNLLSRYYPIPKYELIIEPFAGSGAYSCYHLYNNPNTRTILIDKNDDVAQTWDFLLSCSENDIINYKTPKIDEYAYDFLIKTCSASNAASKCLKMKYSSRISRVFEIQKRRILNLLFIRERIRFIHGDYRDLENIEATWFVDPPYQVKQKTKTIFQNGDGYAKNCDSSSIDFDDLSDYCLSRAGQLIVCEKEGADWLPFSIFRKNKTSLNKNYNEVIFTK